MRSALVSLSIVLFAAVLEPASCGAQDKAGERVTTLETRVSKLEEAVENKAGISGIVLLYGIFAALWAQNTGRSAWLWFFLGLIFSVITGLVILYKNSDERARSPE